MDLFLLIRNKRTINFECLKNEQNQAKGIIAQSDSKKALASCFGNSGYDVIIVLKYRNRTINANCYIFRLTEVAVDLGKQNVKRHIILQHDKGS